MKLIIACSLFLALFAITEAVRAVALTRGDKLAFVNAHNKVRSVLRLPGLRWDDKLASAAARAAETCVFEHTGMPYGENIYTSWPINKNNGVVAKATVKSWASEKKYMSGNNWEPCFKDCGHYSQIVWRKTTKVGCAITHCPDGWNLVFCEYSIPGNMRGEKAY